MRRAWLAVALVVLPMGKARADGGTVVTLSKAIEIARRVSPEIRGVRANVESEDYQARVARAPHYPTLTANVQGTGLAKRDVQIVPATRNAAENLGEFVTYSAAGSGAANLSWTLYDFGRTANAIDNADAQLENAVADLGAQDLSTVADTASAYMNVVYNEQLREVAKQTLTNRETLVTVARGLVKSGLQPPIEEIRAQARAEASRRDLANAEANAADARAVLAPLLGMDPRTEIKVTLPRLKRAPVDVAAALREADKLPTIVAANATVESKKAIARAQKSRFLPTLSFNASAAQNFTRFDTSSLVANTRSMQGALVLSGPIFDASISPAVDAARADAAQAEATLDQVRRDARTEAARAAVAVSSTETMLDHAKKAAEEAAAVLTVVEARYLQGLANPLELINAESDDADARVARVNAELAHALAEVRLLVATNRRIEEAR